MNRTFVRIAVSVSSLGFAVATSAPALAGGNGEVSNHGGCSGSAVWKLKAKPDDGRLEVEGEVDSNRSGQDWRWKIKRNGDVVRHGASTTHGASGSFSVERKIAGNGGTIVFKATRVGGGQTCRGSVTL